MCEHVRECLPQCCFDVQPSHEAVLPELEIRGDDLALLFGELLHILIASVALQIHVLSDKATMHERIV